MMKILQLCTKVPFPPKDGGAAGVYFFAKAFAQLGHTVDVLAVNPPKHFVTDEQLSIESTSIRFHAVKFETAPLIHKALKNLLFQDTPFHVERFINKKFEAKLLELLKANEYDIIQIEGVYLCPYIETIRRHSKAKLVLRAHNIEYALWHDITLNEKHIIKHRFLATQTARLRRYEKEQFAKVDAVTTVTHSDYKIITSFCPNIKISVFPFGIEPIDEPQQFVSNTDAIFFLGALDWSPNIEALKWFVNIVWPVLLLKFPSMQFHVAGRNASPKLAEELENTKGLIFYGEIDDAASFMAEFSIMVVPLFSGSGIRVKIIEAMQHEKIVIASNKAAIGIPAENGKHLFLAESAQDYIEHLNRLKENPKLASEVSRNAQTFVREYFNIKSITNNLLEFYKSIE